VARVLNTELKSVGHLCQSYCSAKANNTANKMQLYSYFLRTRLQQLECDGLDATAENKMPDRGTPASSAHVYSK
jgi:hypothetical protein